MPDVANVAVHDQDGKLLMRMAPGDVLVIYDPGTGRVHTYIQSWGGDEAEAMETLNKARQKRLRDAIAHAVSRA